MSALKLNIYVFNLRAFISRIGSIGCSFHAHLPSLSHSYISTKVELLLTLLYTPSSHKAVRKSLIVSVAL